MGLYNLDQNKNPLPNGVCIVCNSPEIFPVIGNASQDSYDYICKGVCNKHISISGSALNSEYSRELVRNHEAQIELREDVLNSEENQYVILTDTLSFFLGADYEELFPEKSFEQWRAGRLGGLPEKYKGLSSHELEKITACQKKIFHEQVDESLQCLIDNYSANKVKSINPKRYHENEIVAVKKLLEGSSENTSMYDFGTFKKSAELVDNIRSYYNQLVAGKVDYGVISNPKQKTKIGKNAKLQKGLIYAKAYNDYLDYLEKNADDLGGYQPMDMFEENEKLLVVEKLNEFGSSLKKIEVGQQIIYDDLINELQELKQLINVLGKKDWLQLLKGKLVDAGLGQLASKVGDLIIEVFKDQKLLP